jgi:hypothetical protein
VKTDPYEYGLSLYTVQFSGLNVSDPLEYGVPCDEIPEISNATREEADLNRGFNGTYGGTGYNALYWV